MPPDDTASAVPSQSPESPKRTRQVNRAAALRQIGQKFCPVCERVLPYSTFATNRSRYDGVRAHCKECVRRKYHRDRAKLLAQTSLFGNCHYCGVTLKPGNATQDHVVPRIKGGTDDPGNLVLCCLSCNCAKNGRSLEEFRELRRRQRDNVPYFTKKQLAWFAVNNVVLPLGDPYLFWFEKDGTPAKAVR